MRYSVTRLNMFRKCAAQYFFRYQEGLIVPPKAALTLGSSVDAALTCSTGHHGEKLVIGDLQTKMLTGELLPEKTLDDAYLVAFDDRSERTEWASSAEEESTKEQGRAMVRLAHETLCPNIQPESVQEEVLVSFENRDYELICYLDYIDTAFGCREIVDLKTSKSRFSVDKAKSDVQLTAYSMAKHDEELFPYPPVRFDTLVKTKTPSIQQIGAERTQEDYDLLLKSIDRLDTILNEGSLLLHFQPPEQPYPCGDYWCGYWDICRGGKEL